MCCGSVAGSRMIAEECMKWAHQRRAFGKPLITQAVIRAKLASMFAKIEALQAYLENLSALRADLFSARLCVSKRTG